MGWMMGFEPTTTGITIRDSTAELHPPQKPHYATLPGALAGLPGGSRTPDPRLRRPLLYPTELRAVPVFAELVGAAGFEPATLCSQSRCATGLRYTPKPCA
jgi:hypothetical protein